MADSLNTFDIFDAYDDSQANDVQFKSYILTSANSLASLSAVDRVKFIEIIKQAHFYGFQSGTNYTFSNELDGYIKDSDTDNKP